MEIFSPYIVAAGIGWLSAQLSKYVIASIKVKGWASYRQLYFSGNMPSAHSATTMALLVVVGVKDGVGSGLFGLALLFTAVVLYDAMMVRRSSGEQGLALTLLLKQQKSKIALPRVAIGHTPAEVAVGSLVGVLVGSLVCLYGAW